MSDSLLSRLDQIIIFSVLILFCVAFPIGVGIELYDTFSDDNQESKETYIVACAQNCHPYGFAVKHTFKETSCHCELEPLEDYRCDVNIWDKNKTNCKVNK